MIVGVPLFMVAIVSTPVLRISVDLIDESPLNPRKHFVGLDELAASLRRQQFEAVVVRPHPSLEGRYELANGARRYRAAKLGAITHLEAKICALTDEQMFDIILSTGTKGNVDPLTPLEQAAGYADAMQKMALTLEQAAERFSKSVTYVHRRVALLQLPADARAAMDRGELDTYTAFAIARIPGEKGRSEAAQAILHSEVNGGVMPMRAAMLFIEKKICRTLAGAPFDPTDGNLVPSAGACTHCQWRAGNNKETYGDIKNPHTCMNPACFETKVSAARGLVLTKYAVDGKEALPEDINAIVFPKGGEYGLSWKSDYVELTHPVHKDFLKPEVTKIPTWASLCEDRGVKVYVGLDQAGRAVDLVKRTEALAAVSENDAAIFSDAVIRRHGIVKPKPRADTQSIVEHEEKERQLREKAERAAKKRGKKSREWLDELVTAIEGTAAASGPAWGSYTYWSLMFELMLKAIGDEDVIFVCELFGVESTDENPPRKALTDFVARISKERCGALVTAMMITPWLRAEGPDASFVSEWHQAFLSGTESKETESSEPIHAALPKISEEESEKLALLVKAYDGGAGMSAQRCAEVFKMTVEDVCGALQLDLRGVLDLAAQLRQEAEQAFTVAGLAKPTAMNRITKTATASRVAAFADLRWPEDYRRVLKMLSQKVNPEPAKPNEEN